MIELIELPKIVDRRGNLTFLQQGTSLPFAPQRVFWTCNVPAGSIRGGHALKTQSELIIALNGAFEVVVKEPTGATQRFRLDRGDKGLFLPPMTWRWMEGFSTNGMGLHLSDSTYNASDYLRDFQKFIDLNP